MPQQPRVLGLLIALALLVSGGALVAGQYYRLSGYEATSGTVESTGIERGVAYGPSPIGAEEDDLQGVRHYTYSPDISYSYSVDGKRYTNSNVATGTDIATANRSDLAAILPARQPGATTTVYYDPDDPSDAHLVQRYRFFPAGILLAAGLLVLTDTLTPNLKFVNFLTNRVPFATLERVPGVEQTALSTFPEDPTAILDSLQQWEGGEPAPIRAAASPAVWVLCYLFLVDIVFGYVALSSRPYDTWATFPIFAAAAGFMRMGFLRLIDYPER